MTCAANAPLNPDDITGSESDRIWPERCNRRVETQVRCVRQKNVSRSCRIQPIQDRAYIGRRLRYCCRRQSCRRRRIGRQQLQNPPNVVAESRPVEDDQGLRINKETAPLQIAFELRTACSEASGRQCPSESRRWWHRRIAKSVPPSRRSGKRSAIGRGNELRIEFSVSCSALARIWRHREAKRIRGTAAIANVCSTCTNDNYRLGERRRRRRFVTAAA